MDTNTSVWRHYQPGWVHPDFVPYLQYPIRDDRGNLVQINTWKSMGSPALVEPTLVRKGWGIKFMPTSTDFPCPPMFEKNEEDGMCYKAELKHEPVFYTSKAFIPQRQYFPPEPQPRRISESTDMRSTNPLTGGYDITYLPVESSALTKYQRGSEGFGSIWALERTDKYMRSSAGDSYLG